MKRAFLLGLLAAASALSWYEAAAPPVRALAPTPELAQAAAARLDEALALYRSLGLDLLAPHYPVTALLLPDLASLEPFLTPRELEAGRVRAVSFRGPDRNWILVALGAPGDTEVVLAHELAHLTDPQERQPHWRREGRADFLARLRRSPGGVLAPRIEEGLLEQIYQEGALAPSELAAAVRDGPIAADPTFYPLAWLTYDWLYSKGSGRLEVPLGALERALAELGEEAVSAALDNHALALAAVSLPPPAPAPPIAVAPRSAATFALWRAEALRELGKRTLAHERLLALETDHPDDRQIQAALGALAMDEGRTAEAERRLAAAAADPRAEPHVRNRFAMVLLHPGADSAARAARAAAQARLAVAETPQEPLFRLTLAQAEMVAERWEAAAAELRTLARDPAWRARAEEEFAELERRRTAAVRSFLQPRLAHEPEALSSEDQRVLALIAPPPPPLPAPPPAVWPPPGTTIVYGRIDTVHCHGDDKILVLQNRLFPMRFRLRRDRPPHLFSPPLGWKEIPCGVRGFEVNVAYRPGGGSGRVRGDAEAVLF